jgi:hypothetical protein
MVIDAQTAVGMSWKITDCGVPVHLSVEKTSPQLSWVTEDHFSFWPPSPQNRRSDNSI